MEKNEESFQEIEQFYHKFKDLFYKEVEENIKNNEIEFTNSNYLHFLYLTDYALSKTKNRLCISTKGFLKPYEALKESIKKLLDEYSNYLL